MEGNTEGIRFKSAESKAMAAQLLFSEKQADAILEMRLYKLIGLELDALVKEHEETVAKIYRYEDILDDRESMSMVIQDELRLVRKAYASPRKTLITRMEEAVYEEKPVEEADVAFIKRPTRKRPIALLILPASLTTGRISCHGLMMSPKEGGGLNIRHKNWFCAAFHQGGSSFLANTTSR